MPPIDIDLYHLGFLGQILYLLRFAVQWVASEIRKKSVVPLSFWVISILASFVMVVHYAIQAHVAFSILNWIGTYIALRNWTIMQGGRHKPIQKHLFLHSACICAGLIALLTCFVLIRSANVECAWRTWQFWIAPPSSTPANTSISWQMHTFGTAGALILAVRFWIQWSLAERGQESTHLGSYFWIMSVIGSIMVIVYSFEMRDWVTGFGPIIVLPMYARNLVLIAFKKVKRARR